LSATGSLKRGLIDLLYPPRCLVCDFPGEPALCAECCSLAVAADMAPESVALGLERVAAAGRYNGVLREAIHGLKYGRRRGLAAPLGALLARRLEDVLAEWWPDVVMPVPIHWGRRLRRGFNQAGLLAEEVADQAQLPADQHSLVRVRRTRSQVGLSGEERRRNLTGAFQVRSTAGVRDCTVLLVDDVYTTGATLGECAQALRAAGARAVYGLVLGC
jgi:ComF family protein